jgi:hypothetical protein
MSGSANGRMVKLHDDNALQPLTQLTSWENSEDLCPRIRAKTLSSRAGVFGRNGRIGEIAQVDFT